MESEVRPFALFVETNSSQFDADSLFEMVRSISDGVVWNYITGAYFFKSRLNTNEISKIIRDEAFPVHVVMEVSPTAASGYLPSTAWESWFADLFFEERNQIAHAKGWDPSVFETIRKKPK